MAKVSTTVQAPVVLAFPITDDLSNLDFRTVTGCSFYVTRPDGLSLTWSGIVIAQGVGVLSVGHAFAPLVGGVGDCPITGIWMITPKLVVPPGTVDCAPRPLLVTTPQGTT